MFRRVVLDDDEWLITTGLFGSMQVRYKPSGRICKVYSGERRHLDDVIAELRKAGLSVEPSSEAFSGILKQFAKSIMLRGDTAWRDFFVHATAREIAEAASGGRSIKAGVELGGPFAMARPSVN